MQTKVLVLVLALLFSASAVAQADSTSNQEEEIDIPEEVIDEEEPIGFFDVSEPAKFKGGDEALYKFVAEQINYPEIALQEEVEGRIMVRFTVNTDGTVSDIETVGSKVGYGLEEEAKRIVRLTSGKWTPAKQQDKAVRMRFMLPIRFTLVD